MAATKPRTTGKLVVAKKKKGQSSSFQKLQQHQPNDETHLAKKNLNVSAGLCFYEKAKSRRSRHRLALANQPCVALKTHVVKQTSAVFQDDDQVEESYQQRGVERLSQIATTTTSRRKSYDPAAVSAKVRKMHQQRLARRASAPPLLRPPSRKQPGISNKHPPPVKKQPSPVKKTNTRATFPACSFPTRHQKEDPIPRKRKKGDFRDAAVTSRLLLKNEPPRK